MGRLAVKSSVLKALFSKSGNQCAFPGCSQPLFNQKNQFIAQVCHIEAAMEGGERYNSKSDDEYRRSYENLIILCYPHHIETNDVQEYTVERLKQIKNEHEQLLEKSNFKIDELQLRKLSEQMSQYWENIELLNTVKHKYLGSGVARRIDGRSDFIQVTEDINNAVEEIEYLLNCLCDSDEKLSKDLNEFLKTKNIDYKIFNGIPYYSNPFVDRNWEIHKIGLPNCLDTIKISLVQAEVKYYEEYVKTHSDDIVAKERFTEVKKYLKYLAQQSVYFD